MKKLLLVVFLLFIPQISLAFDITVPDRTINAPIGSSVQADVEISSSIDDSFNLNIVDSKSWISLSDTRLNVDAGKTGSLTITFSPYMDTTLGLYRVRFVAESLEQGTEESKEIYISVVREGVVEIEKIFVTGDLEPAGLVNITIQARSFAATTAQEIYVKGIVSSPTKDVFSFVDTIEKIDPDESAAVDKIFYLEDFAEAGIYTVEASLEYQDKTSKLTQSFVVIEKAVVRKEVSDFLVLGTGKAINVTNIGNKKSGKVVVNETVSGIDQIFFSGEPTEIVNDTYIWVVSPLDTRESVLIKYQIDYFPLFIAIIIIMVLIWFVIFKVRTVVIKKSILQKKEIKEGSEFTVGIDIKNNTGGTIKNIMIRDFVPSAFSVRDAHGPRPTKRETSMGTEIKWEVDALNKGEERIMTYKIVPVFGVHGEVKLPSASLRFKKKGVSFETISNSAFLGLVTKKKE